MPRRRRLASGSSLGAVLARRGIARCAGRIAVAGRDSAPRFAARNRECADLPRRPIGRRERDSVFLARLSRDQARTEAGAVKATIKVAPDCRLGEHVAHVRTASGVTEYRTFYVGPFPEIKEKEPNTEFTTPQAIPMNVTVNGVIDSEDVDYFVVDAKKGQRISAEIEGMRLGVTMFDPYIAILDSKRFELITADDTPLLKQDAAASVIAPADGKYYIQVRETSYGGDGNCYYRLHVGNFPRPIAVYPAGGKLRRPGRGPVPRRSDRRHRQEGQTSQPARHEFRLVPEDATGTAPSGIPFRLSDHGNVLEKEPNNSIKEATPAELPLAFNGILQKPGDVDFFRFKAKKGETYEVECYGRRIRSAIDRGDGAL